MEAILAESPHDLMSTNRPPVVPAMQRSTNKIMVQTNLGIKLGPCEK
jgi:hypothetical protein